MLVRNRNNQYAVPNRSISYKGTVKGRSYCYQFSRVRLFETPWAAACQASLSITNSWSLFKLMSIESVMPSNHLILCCPLLLPSIFPNTRVFSSESVLRFRWPKYWSFSFSISLPVNVQDWFPLGLTGLIYLKSKGLFKSLLQHSSANASIIWHSAFFIVQLWHPYMTTGKTWVSTRQTFVGKVMPLLFNMLSKLVIAFLPRSKHLLISWLQLPSAVILEPRKRKSVTVSIVCPSVSHEGVRPEAMMLVFWMLSFKPTF